MSDATAQGAPVPPAPNPRAARRKALADGASQLGKVLVVTVAALVLAASSFMTGSAWNDAFKDLAKRHNVPLTRYAGVLTLGTITVAIVLGGIVAALRVEGNVTSVAAAASSMSKVVPAFSAMHASQRPKTT